MTAIPLSQLATSKRWQKNFLAVLPAVQSHATFCFRRLNLTDKEEATAEAIASAFVSYGELVRRRELDRAYVGSLARYAVKVVKSCRHVGGRQSSRDVMSPLTQKRRSLTVSSLSRWSHSENTWRDVVLESTTICPADQACFNVDFQEWIRQWPERHRRIINALASGDRTMAVAKRFGTSEARISQMRREYERSWQQFQGMPQSQAA